MEGLGVGLHVYGSGAFRATIGFLKRGSFKGLYGGCRVQVPSLLEQEFRGVLHQNLIWTTRVQCSLLMLFRPYRV